MNYHIEHSIRVANLSKKLVDLLDFPSEVKKTIYKSALLHDIGKIKIKSKILNKSGKLTNVEFEHIKKHSDYGYQYGLKLGLQKNEALNILHHHENYDGSGYPEGLKGKDIPLGARIIRITDVYDALTSDRPYRKGLSRNKALEIMKLEKKNFDENLLKIFLNNINSRGDFINEIYGKI